VSTSALIAILQSIVECQCNECRLGMSHFAPNYFLTNRYVDVHQAITMTMSDDFFRPSADPDAVTVTVTEVGPRYIHTFITRTVVKHKA